MNDIIKLISITTTYPESTESVKPKFVHLLNKELVKLGVDVQTICPHSKDSVSEIIDGVKIKRFRYLPQSLEGENLFLKTLKYP